MLIPTTAQMTFSQCLSVLSQLCNTHVHYHVSLEAIWSLSGGDKLQVETVIILSGLENNTIMQNVSMQTDKSIM